MKMAARNRAEVVAAERDAGIISINNIHIIRISFPKSKQVHRS
jgi:hypothetical protein